MQRFNDFLCAKNLINRFSFIYLTGFFFFGLSLSSQLDGLPVLFEGRGAYFVSRSGSEWGAEATWQVQENWHGWISASYLAGNDATVVPLAIGFKYEWPSGKFHENLRPYLGAGVEAAYLSGKKEHMTSFGGSGFYFNHIKEHKKISKLGVGGVLKSGLLYPISDRFYVDVFGDYSFLRCKDVNVSGFLLGLGIGYTFWETSCCPE